MLLLSCVGHYALLRSVAASCSHVRRIKTGLKNPVLISDVGHHACWLWHSLALARLLPHPAYASLVGLPGFEPGINPPHGLVLPLHYSPGST